MFSAARPVPFPLPRLGTHGRALPTDGMSKRGRDESGGWKGTHVLAVAQFDDAMLLELFDAARRMKLMVAAKGKSDVLRGKVETLALALALARCSPTSSTSRRPNPDPSPNPDPDQVLANVFYEPSTRTMCSFDAAMKRLGGDVLAVNESSSSAKKGETIEDTVRCLQRYCDPNPDPDPNPNSDPHPSPGSNPDPNPNQVRCLQCYCDVLVLRHPQVGTVAKAAAAAQKPVLNAGDGVGEHPTQALLDLFTIIDTRAKAATGTALLDLSGLTLTMARHRGLEP